MGNRRYVLYEENETDKTGKGERRIWKEERFFAIILFADKDFFHVKPESVTMEAVMRLLFELDKKDYEQCTHSFVRNSARSIIIIRVLELLIAEGMFDRS